MMTNNGYYNAQRCSRSFLPTAIITDLFTTTNDSYLLLTPFSSKYFFLGLKTYYQVQFNKFFSAVCLLRKLFLMRQKCVLCRNPGWHMVQFGLRLICYDLFTFSFERQLSTYAAQSVYSWAKTVLLLYI